MNKLFTKIGVTMVGIAMAVGVGVAVGKDGVTKVRAGEEVAYTLTPTLIANTTDPANYSNQYDKATSGVTIDGVGWEAILNTAMNPWRFGGKNISSAVDRTLSSMSAVSTNDITKVEVETGTKTITIDKVKLFVGTTKGASDISSISLDWSASDTLTFERPAGKSWASRYFTIAYHVTNSANSNKYAEFKGATFYYLNQSTHTATELTSSIESLEPQNGDVINTALSELVVTAKYDGAETSTPYTNYSLRIQRRDDSLVIVGNDTTFEPGDKKIVITAKDPISQEGEESFSSVDIPVSVSYTAAVEVGKTYALTGVKDEGNYQAVSYDGSSKRLIADSYDEAPKAYPLLVEEGSLPATYALKNGDKYLNWTDSDTNGISQSDEIGNSSSWVIYVEGGKTIILNAANTTRRIRLNSGQSNNYYFAAYASDTGSSVELVNIDKTLVQDFVDTNMHLTDVPVSESSRQSSGETCKTYYVTAKAALTALTSVQITLFKSDDDFNNAQERYESWADIYGDTTPYSKDVTPKAGSVAAISSNSNSGLTAIIIIAAALTTLAVGGIFLLKKKEEK